MVHDKDDKVARALAARVRHRVQPREAGESAGTALAAVSGWAQESDRPQAGRHRWAMDRAVPAVASPALAVPMSSALPPAGAKRLELSRSGCVIPSSWTLSGYTWAA